MRKQLKELEKAIKLFGGISNMSRAVGCMRATIYAAKRRGETIDNKEDLVKLDTGIKIENASEGKIKMKNLCPKSFKMLKMLKKHIS